APTSLNPNCAAVDERALAEIGRQKPDIVVVFGRWQYYNSHGTDVLSQIRQTVDRLSEAGIRVVVVVGPAPQWQPTRPQRLFPESFLRGGQIPAHMEDASQDADKVLDRQMSKALVGTSATYISLFDLLCGADGCRTVVSQDGRDEL